MKRNNKISCMVLVLALLASLLCVPVYADEKYTTNCTSEDYARAATDWGATPLTITETIGVNEERYITLATYFWVEASGYTEEPVKLDADFTDGDGLLEFRTFVGDGTIWQGTPCEVLVVSATDAAAQLTEAVTATGAIDIYWCGDVKMPFSITIDPNKVAPAAAGTQSDDGYNVVLNTSEDYANAATDLGVEPIPIKERIGLKDRMLISLCTAYWVDGSGYSASATPLSPVFEEGDGLLAFDVYVGEGTIWDGADCAILRVWPTEAAQSLSSAVTVTGRLPIYWCGETEMEFSIIVDPAAGKEGQVTGPLFVDNTTPEDELEEGYDLRADVNAILDSWETGQSAMAIARRLFRTKVYGALPVMSNEIIAKFPCALDGDECEAAAKFTAANARVIFSRNASLADISFTDQDGIVMMNVVLTEEAQKTELPQRIEGEIFFEEGLHMTTSIPFSFLLMDEAAPESNFDIMNVILIAETVVLVAGAVGIALLLIKKKKKEV